METPEAVARPSRPVAGSWILSRTAAERFPYRLQILDHNGSPVLVVRAQDRWPGANQNLFCLREKTPPEAEVQQTEVERVGIVALQRRGQRLSVVLDRPRFKRCDFIVVSRPLKDGLAAREQIFWQTQASMTQRRTKVAPSVLNRRGTYTVKVAPEERYPWTFPGSTVVRGLLAAGDYALLKDDEPRAVVERKTMANLLADFGVMPVLHQRLLELGTYEHNALVVEAPYEDFLSTTKVSYYSPAFCAAAIAELYARHPRVRIVFCSNRKTANLWTRSFFAAVSALGEEA